MTQIVNLIGAPGVGKSTTRAGVFHKLKLAGVNAEECVEYAKDLTWEGRTMALGCQPYVFGKQLRNMERLVGKVEVIVTDSPLILSAFYDVKYGGGRYPASFRQFVIEQFKTMGGVTYFLGRVKPYNPIGRNQTEAESDLFGGQIRSMLDNYGIEYTVLPGDEAAVDRIVDETRYRLRQEQKSRTKADDPSAA